MWRKKMSVNIVEAFEKKFGKKAAFVAKAPGRLEILGNHTDYNQGFVLSAAVSQATEFVIAPAEGRKCRIWDFRGNCGAEFDLDNISKPTPKDWSNYIKGVIVELAKRGIKIGAFDAGILSTVPLSAGMSSSAALEVAASFAFSKLFNINLAKEDWARVGQGVENNYMGLKSGLLDQFSSIFGKENSLILCDFRDVKVLKTVPVPEGYCFVVGNSMVKHNLVESDYNLRRASCEKAVEGIKKKYPEVKALRDVSQTMLDSCKDLMDKVDYLRACHVVGEDERVMKAEKALEHGDIQEFGKLLFESHASSISNFENSCVELDCLVELAKTIPGCLGARLSGGGFGGITIHLVKEAVAESYCTKLKTAYKTQTGKSIETIICSIGDGASVKEVK